MKRYLALILTFLLVGCAHKVITPDANQYTKIVLLGTNDVHGYLKPKEEDFYGQKLISGGAEWFAGYIRILQKKYGENVFILDGGDIFQGTMESNTFLGKPMIAYYNLLPYRAAAIGNHEFDYGPEKKGHPDRLGAIKARMKEAKFPFVTSNIFDIKTGKNWQEENLFSRVIFTIDGIKIGVFGLTTESTPLKTRPQNVKSLDFRSIREATIRESAKLREDGADVVLFAAHEGGDLLSEPIYELLHSIPTGTVDAAVTGHSHTKINRFINGVPVIQSMTRGVFFGRIDLYVDRNTKRLNPSLTKIHETIAICGTYFKNEDSCNSRTAKEAIKQDAGKLESYLPLRPAMYEGELVKPDQAVHDVLNPFIAKVNQLRGKIVGKAERDFVVLPSGETETGNLLTDALRMAYPKAKVAYYNGGGIRRNLAAGTITYGDMFEVMPFDNAVVLAKMDGATFRNMIEIGFSGDMTIGVASGVQIEYFGGDDPRFDRDLNGDGKKDRWERNRVKSIKWSNGEPIKDKEEFWIITNDFLLDGGDRMGFIFSKIPRSRVKIEDVSLLDAVVNQLGKFKSRIPTKGAPRVTKISE
jgi:5'-nucleotidase